jgi:tetratricopeptide (TPR) repeat protein
MNGGSSASKTLHELQGTRIAITGRFATMTHEECIATLEAHGAEHQSRVREDTDALVVGAIGWPLQEDGRETQLLRDAQQLRRKGHALAILSERELLELLQLDEQRQDIERLYTTQQLSRMLDVPARQIRSWIRQGLIVPRKVVHRLLYFDFPQVARARSIAQLARAGHSAAEIQRSLADFADWHPEASEVLGQIQALDDGGPLLARLEDGKLRSPRGQMWFDFGASPEDGDGSEEDAPSTIEIPRLRPDTRSEEWFRRGVEAEERGEWEEALHCYQDALLSGGPDSEIAFHLAGVLYVLDRPEEATQRLMQVVEIEYDYVEAWYVLGRVLGEIGRAEDSLRAFQVALSIQPSYADAHVEIAETLLRLGRQSDARRHFEAYLEHDPRSEWATEIRKRLAELGGPQRS